MRVSKLQAPSFKLQGSSKLPIQKRSPSQGFLGPWALGCFWSLGFGISLELGAWSLEFCRMAPVGSHACRGAAVARGCARLGFYVAPRLGHLLRLQMAHLAPRLPPRFPSPYHPLPRLPPRLARHGCESVSRSSKPQAPSSRKIPNTKPRKPLGERLVGGSRIAFRKPEKHPAQSPPTWSLEFGISLEFGVWSLEFCRSENPRRCRADLGCRAPSLQPSSAPHRLARYDRRRALPALRLVPSSGSRLATCRGQRPTGHALPVPGHVAG